MIRLRASLQTEGTTLIILATVYMVDVMVGKNETNPKTRLICSKTASINYRMFYSHWE